MSKALWRDFAALRDADSRYDDPFFDPDFAQLVASVRGDTHVGLAMDGEALVGIWPLHKRPGGWARPIGGPFSDWHAPILAKDTALTAQAFLSGLDLSGMTVFGFQPRHGQRIAGLERVGANMTDLSGGFESFIADQQKRWPKHFKKMRRLYRNVERDFSEKVFTFDNKDDAAFARLYDLKQAQFARTGYHDVLKPEWARQLLDKLRHFEGARLRTRLVTLHYDGQHAASELNLQSDTVMHGWLTGFDQEMGTYSPGNMLVQEMLEQMCVAKIPIYDAGPGLDHYKRHYSNYQLPIDTGSVRGARGSFAPSRIAGRIWRSGERALPGKAGELMARARRRVDQIALAETTMSARVAGLFSALSHRDL